MVSVIGVLPELASVCPVSVGARVPAARNVLVSQFLAGNGEWLWCVDTDMVFTPEALGCLLEVADPDARPVISGLAHILRNGTQIPAAYSFARDGEGELSLSPMSSWEEGSVVRVDAVGAACLLVHRSVLKKIQEASGGEPCWFREAVVGHRDVGEDISFCLRAASVGIPVYVHTGVRVGHMKTTMLGTVAARQFRLRPARLPVLLVVVLGQRSGPRSLAGPRSRPPGAQLAPGPGPLPGGESGCRRWVT